MGGCFIIAMLNRLASQFFLPKDECLVSFRKINLFRKVISMKLRMSLRL